MHKAYYVIFEDKAIDLMELNAMGKNRVACSRVEGNFLNDGFTIFRSFFDEDEVTNIFQHIRENEEFVVKKLKNELEKNPKIKGMAIEKDKIKYLKNPNFWFVELNRLLQLELFLKASELVNQNLYISDFELHQKYPGTSDTPPHQDNFYFGLDLDKNIACTAYVALNHQTPDQGGLGFYPKSHLHHLKHKSSTNIGFSSGIDQADLRGFELYNPVFNPGDVVFHHCNIVHAASKNSTNKIRTNAAIRLFPVAGVFDNKLQATYKEFFEQSNRLG